MNTYNVINCIHILKLHSIHSTNTKLTSTDKISNLVYTVILPTI